jgi:probable F420-dependent oxidoreductase
MKFGFNMPTAGALAGAADIARLAIAGETMGFDYLTFSDHVVIPHDISTRYPYTDTGEFPAGARGGRHEQLIEIAFVAGMTRRIRLVTSVMVVPHRPRVLAAKQLATIDVLSGGRLTVGIGAGWLKEEIETLGAPPFAERGAVTDEYLAAFRELWTAENPRFEGRYARFAGIVLAPKPVQSPHPPVWVGGESGPALRRTARLGDAWYPIGTNPSFPLDSLKRLEAGIAKLRRLATEAGRNPDAVGVAYRIQSYGAHLPAKAGDGERRLFAGTTAEIAADLRGLAALGVGHVDIGFGAGTTDGAIEELKRFRDEVLAKV